MKKICFVTSARSEYGLLKWLMKEVDSSDFFKLQIIVTGGHLLIDQGHTVDNIIDDGFRIDSEIDIALDYTSKRGISSSMGRIAERISEEYDRLDPDYVVVLGDRYELLPICNAAFVMGIPIVHISGGDITVGAIDNGIRNAVTMLATYHFPGTADSADNIVRMRASEDNVWAVGEPGLDSFRREEMLEKEAIADILGLDISKKWALLTYHPETVSDIESDLSAVDNCLNALQEYSDIQVIATYANTDPGGKEINELLENRALNDAKRIKVFASLGNKNYLSLMHYVSLVIGNSSSGIVEAPMLGIAVVNIGDRQKGRHFCKNIIQSNGTYDEIKKSVSKALECKSVVSDGDYWGDGHTSERILSIMEKVL